MQKLVVNVLKTLGVGQVYSASDGEAGYAAFCAYKPDIVLTDWHMEPVCGIEMIKRIRNREKSPNPTVPIILMTGYSAYPRVEEARNAGATEFLIKPFSASDLARRIAYVINKPRDFVKAPDYFGPDRRRRQEDGYSGEKKRASDLDE